MVYLEESVDLAFGKILKNKKSLESIARDFLFFILHLEVFL